MFPSVSNACETETSATDWSARLSFTRDVPTESPDRQFIKNRLLHGSRRLGLHATLLVGALLIEPSPALAVEPNCSPFGEALSMSQTGYLPLQIAPQPPDSNFVAAKKVLAGAARCRVYHDDERTYHSYDCRFYADGEEQAKVIYDDWVTRAQSCAGSALADDSSDTSRRILASTKFKLQTEDGVNPRIRVSHRVDSDGAHYIEVGLTTNTPEPIGSDGREAASSVSGTSPPSVTASERFQRQLNSDMAQTSLWLAASEGNIDNIREALEAGAKINGPPGDKNAPLGAAIMGDHVDAAAVLLAAGADVNALCLGNTPAFELAVYQKNPNMIRLLLTRANQRVDVSLKPDQTPDSFAPPLLRMLDIDDPELLELFLSRADGIDLDAVDAVGRSAFEIAANKPALLDVLLRYRDQRR